jgi:hypothetical protein
MRDVIQAVLSVPALAAASVWFAACYLVLGPEIGRRVLITDHAPACRQALVQGHEEEREERIRDLLADALGLPRFVADTLPIEQLLEQLPTELQADVYRMLDELGLGVPADTVAGNGDPCSCAAEVAVERDRIAWALFVGTGSLLRTASLREPGRILPPLARSESCAASTEPWP